jgi:transposase-like protein
MANHSRAATRQAWAERIERFEQAGQTIAQFCATEGVSAACFYQWRRKLRSGASVTQPLAGFLPVRLQSSPQIQPSTVMSVELPGGVRIRFEVNAGSQETS